MRSLWVSLLLLLYANCSCALKTDSEKPIYIEANNANFNRLSGISIYEGNVIVTQGTARLTADKVITQADKNSNIIDLFAIGNPAYYETQPSAKKSLLKIHANTIHYHVKDKYVELIGDAHASQEKDKIEGPHLIYHLAEQSLTSPGIISGRTTLVLHPKG